MNVETKFTLILNNKVANVEEWGEILNLSPLYSCIKGNKETSHPSSPVSEDSFVIFGIKRSPEISVEFQLDELIDQIYARKNKLMKLVRDLQLEVFCESFVWPDYGLPLSIKFDFRLIKKIVELGASYTLTRY